MGDPAAPRARLTVTPLGGVGRFGGNAMLFDTGTSAVLVDCGLRFLDHDEAPGFDFGLCDLDALERVGHRLHAYLVTHGHEDHVGALPYAYERAPAPIWASPFTRFRAEKAFERAGAPFPDDVNLWEPGFVGQIGEFEVEAFAVSHSIPGSLALALTTAAGTVVHSGDFRVDRDPLVGPPTDLAGLDDRGARGVDLLVADSTSVGVPGHNAGERSVVEPLLRAVQEAEGKVVVATFGSHVQRVAACAEVCRHTGRKMRLVGLSLVNSVRQARELGLLPIEDVLIGHDEQRQGRGRGRGRRGGGQSVPDGKLLIVASGCQGEPQGSVAQIARGEHRLVDLRRGDTLIFSARVIPGNERAVASLFDQLAERGVNVVDGREGRHVSGHGSAGDLEALLTATSPRAFAPIHGGGRQLAHHRALAVRTGVPREAIFPIEDGVSLTLDDEGISMHPGPPLTERWIQGRHIVPHAQRVADERRRMSLAGLLLLSRAEGAVTVNGRALAPGLTSGSARRFVTHRAEELWDEGEPKRTKVLAAKLRSRFGVAPEIWWLDR